MSRTEQTLSGEPAVRPSPRFSFGPGALVAAAFIGPGTVTACTLAGANFGFALIWALVFATLATIVLQDMAARLGAGAGLGLGEAMMARASTGPMRWLLGGLVFAAIAIGNAAYEAGNLSGGALGLDAILAGTLDSRPAVLAIAAVAALVLWHGRYQVLERILISLVVLMSLAFLASAALVRPDLGALAGGLVPRVPDGATLTAIALIGTTIVPYNLFLHAAAARDKWPGGAGVQAARRETVVSVGLGGLISIMVLTTAAASLFGRPGSIESAVDMARAIEPVFGTAARYLIGIGLLAAGLTSAITAPMAAGYVMTELFPTPDAAQRRNRFRAVALAILGIGLAVSLLGLKPVSVILIAQVANGLLLPIVALVLIGVMNDRARLGTHTNGPLANLAGWAVVTVAAGLGLRSLLRAAGVWP